MKKGNDDNYIFKKLTINNPKEFIENLTKIVTSENKDIEKKEILNYLKENQDKFYKPFLELNSEKLKELKDNCNELNKTLELVRELGKMYNFDIKKEKDKLEFKAITFEENGENLKEISANNYKEFKNKVLNEVIKNNPEEKEKYQRKYNKDYLDRDYKIELEKDFRFSYKKNTTFYSKKMLLNIDLGKNQDKIFRKDYDEKEGKEIKKINSLLTTKDYINTCIPEIKDDKTFIYKDIENVKKLNSKLYKSILETKEKENWDDIVNDVCANAFSHISSFDYTNKKELLDKIETNLVEYFERRFLKNEKIDKYLENSFVNNGNFSQELYKDNIKEFFKEKFSNKILEILDDVNDKIIQASVNDLDSEFKDLQLVYAELETGTLRKEKEFLKNAFAITVNEFKPNLVEELDNFEKENPYKNKSYFSEIFEDYKFLDFFKKELKKNYGYEYEITDKNFKELKEDFIFNGTNKYDFIIQKKIDKDFSQTFIETTKKEAKENKKEQEFEM